MGLKEELAEKLAAIDCKDKIKEVLDERQEDIKEALYLDRKTKKSSMPFKKKLFLVNYLCLALLLGFFIGELVLMLTLGE